MKNPRPHEVSSRSLGSKDSALAELQGLMRFFFDLG